MEKTIYLNRPRRGQPRAGHPWIYASQVERTEGDPAPGDLVRVRSGKALVGTGYFNPQSQIRVRLIARGDAHVDLAFLKKRLEGAAAFRARWVRDTNAMRLVSSEADGLPGLIIDRYGEVLVIQLLTLGMEKLRPLLLEAIEAVFPSKGIYEKSDSSSRRIEGLEERVGWVRQDCGGDVTIVEGGVKFSMRFEEGHKTGFYLDQRENRLALAAMDLKGDALDAFCYEGGFGIHLARAGMRVLGIDIQPDTVARAEANRKLNGLTEAQIVFRAANVFDELKALEKESRRFDLVILDPPSFVKKKAALEGALAGYKEILLRGMRLTKEGGLLAVFSCSYHVDENLLMQTSMEAAHDTRRSLRLMRFLKQSSDHPIDPFVPETYYLKGFLFSVGPSDIQ